VPVGKPLPTWPQCDDQMWLTRYLSRQATASATAAHAATKSESGRWGTAVL
jgi:hypothetical protein